jgi:hypothetical protein
MSDGEDFPPQYKKGVDAANALLAEGAVRILSIWEELQGNAEGQSYELELEPDIIITIKRKTE